MGRLQNASNKRLEHFSHPHELELCSSACFQNSTLCSCCELPPSGDMYTCNPCNFILHSTCAQFPPLITHPSHPNHNLTLLPNSSYPGGIFNCDACNSQGNGFSYHCSSCEYDLHVICASKPLKITVQFHSCPLELAFNNPYDNAKGFHCDVCRKIEYKQWLYRCSSCEFDVHLDCITASPAPVTQGQAHLLQHPHSFPGAIFHYQNHDVLRPNTYAHGANIYAIPHQQFQANPTAATQFSAPGRPSYFMHSASTGSIQNMAQPTRTNNLMNAVIQGVVEGASQQVGQSLVLSMIGGGGSGGSGGDGSSFLGNILGDSSGAQN